jgi:hypothetical protein
MRALLFILALPLHLAAIEIEIRFSLLESLLAKQLFTEDGKRYVRGDAKNRCNFAYLADPHFSSRDSQLLIRARFTGRSSMDVFGKCLGFGDSFEFEVLSQLTTRAGTLLLDKPQVQILSRDTFYSRKVLKALQASIGDAVRYPLRDEIRKLLETGSANTPYKISIPKIEIRSVQILKDSLLVDVDTRFLVEQRAP